MKRGKKKVIFNYLRKYRKARGLKQKEAAHILGLKAASMVSRWENGICLPKPVNMFKLAVLYRTMADALFIDLRRTLQKKIIRAEEELLKDKSKDQTSKSL
jgi:transcriptional regulator with XRE-family HTH domain